MVFEEVISPHSEEAVGEFLWKIEDRCPRWEAPGFSYYFFVILFCAYFSNLGIYGGDEELHQHAQWGRIMAGMGVALLVAFFAAVFVEPKVKGTYRKMYHEVFRQAATNAASAITFDRDMLSDAARLWERIYQPTRAEEDAAKKRRFQMFRDILDETFSQDMQADYTKAFSAQVLEEMRKL